MSGQLHSHRQSEQGAALLTVLLMVAVMAAVSVALTDGLRTAIRRSANASEQAQLTWYLRGAEDYAASLVKETPESAMNRVISSDDRRNEALYDIDGGWIRARVEDGGNCFNLNSLVTEADADRFEVNEKGRAQFRQLLEALDFSEGEAERLAAAVVDWIDSDSRPLAGGAEDFDYLEAQPAYRTGNTLLADVTELRAIRGFDAETYRRVRPHVCALPGPAETVLNINTLKESQAPLLVMLKGRSLTVAEAQRVLASRPDGGFDSVDVFWDLDAMKSPPVSDDIKEQTVLRSRLFRLSAEVQYHDSYGRMAALMERSGQTVTTVQRRRGEDL